MLISTTMMTFPETNSDDGSSACEADNWDSMESNVSDNPFDIVSDNTYGTIAGIVEVCYAMW
jgi:hypothetical protein